MFTDTSAYVWQVLREQIAKSISKNATVIRVWRVLASTRSVVTPANVTKDSKELIVKSTSTNANVIHPANTVLASTDVPIIIAFAMHFTVEKIARYRFPVVRVTLV